MIDSVKDAKASCSWETWDSSDGDIWLEDSLLALLDFL